MTTRLRISKIIWTSSLSKLPVHRICSSNGQGVQFGYGPTTPAKRYMSGSANEKSHTPTWTWRHVESNRLVAVPAHVMFHVVSNVDEYSEFVPYCTKSHILRYSPHHPHGSMFDALLTVGLLSDNQSKVDWATHETYVSRVTLSHARPDLFDEDSKLVDCMSVHAKSIQTSERLLHAVSSLWTIQGMHHNNSTCNVNFEVEMVLRRNNESDHQLSDKTPLQMLRDAASSASMSPTILRPLLKRVANQQVKAFEKRAIQLLHKLRQS